MQGDRPTIQECEALGRERMRELIELESSTPDDYFSRMLELSWIRVKEVFVHSLTDRGGFYPALLEFVDILRHVVINQRGPGILGHLAHLELNFSLRAHSSYDPQSRVMRLNLGHLLFANELEATCRWLESVLFGRAAAMSPAELARQDVPSAVSDELAALFRGAGTEGLPVSGKHALAHPIGAMLLRFVIAHELGHLIDLAESPKQQASWRKTAWSDYDDALDYCLNVGWVDEARYTQFRRPSLSEHVASRWASEFVADGLGFYTVSSLAPPVDIDPRLAYAQLQIAVELFFYSNIIAYRGDVGTDSHPPPTIRSWVIRAQRRKHQGVSWAQFLSDQWGPGHITSEILSATIRKIGGTP